MLQEPQWPWRTMMSHLIEVGKPAAMARSLSKEHCLKRNLPKIKNITKVAEDDALKQMVAITGLLLQRKILTSL